MKKLFAAASYSFNNFYNNLNTQGQMIFSMIIILILILCALLFIAYIIQIIQNKGKIKVVEEDELPPADTDSSIAKQEEYKENKRTEIQDIAKSIEEALVSENPITLTNFEEDQEKTAIISIEELMKKAKKLNIIEDEDMENRVDYLKKYNLEPSEIETVVNKTVKNEPQEVKAFKVSQVISPIYGVKKEVINNQK